MNRIRVQRYGWQRKLRIMKEMLLKNEVMLISEIHAFTPFDNNIVASCDVSWSSSRLINAMTSIMFCLWFNSKNHVIFFSSWSLSFTFFYLNMTHFFSKNRLTKNRRRFVIQMSCMRRIHVKRVL